MAGKLYTIDARVSRPKLDGGSFLWGIYRTRNTFGGDRSAYEKLHGLYLEHPYSGYIYDSLAGSVYVRRTRLSDGHVDEGYVGPIDVTYSQARVWDSNDEIALIGNLTSQIKNGATWNAGIFVGELGKTVDSITSRVRTLTDAVRATRRGDWRRAVSALRSKPRRTPRTVVTPGNASWYELWLELRYAWRPLIKDIYDLSESIQKRDLPRKKLFRVQLQIPRTVNTSVPFYSNVTGKGGYLKAIKATISEKPFSFPEYLGLYNPESVVWELVPLSFVADWFIPIGRYLEVRSDLQGVQGEYVRTTYDWYRGRILHKDVSPDAAYSWSTSDESGYVASMNIARTLSFVLSVPLPSFRSPGFESRPARLLDAIALLVAAVKR